MPERSTSTDSYRYAYNGMEMDNEVSGNGNSYTTEFRQYDARLGRWKSLDPLMGMFPSMSPYVAFDNNPVYYTDIYGLSSGGPGSDGANEGGGAGDKGGLSGIMGEESGSRIGESHDWERSTSNDMKYYDVNENTNIQKAINRTGIGSFGKMTFNENRTYEACGYICKDVAELNEFYDDDYVWESDWNNVLREDQSSPKYPDNNIYKTETTNTFVIRDDYIYHKQTIKRTDHYFNPISGKYKFTRVSTIVVEEKQYFDLKNSDENHFKLLPHKLFTKKNIKTGPTKVLNVTITKEMHQLIQEVMDAWNRARTVHDYRQHMEDFEQEFYENTRDVEERNQ